MFVSRVGASSNCASSSHCSPLAPTLQKYTVHCWNAPVLIQRTKKGCRTTQISSSCSLYLSCSLYCVKCVIWHMPLQQFSKLDNTEKTLFLAWLGHSWPFLIMDSPSRMMLLFCMLIRLLLVTSIDVTRKHVYHHSRHAFLRREKWSIVVKGLRGGEGDVWGGSEVWWHTVSDQLP